MALRAQIDTNTVIVGDLNTQLSPVERTSRQNIDRETSELLYTLDQIDKVDINRVFCQTTRQYTLFSTAHGSFSKIEHILGHKASLNKFKKIEISSCIISNHNRMKLDFKNKIIPRKYSNTEKLKNTLLKKPMSD
jgi:exonuclease III